MSHILFKFSTFAAGFPIPTFTIDLKCNNTTQRGLGGGSSFSFFFLLFLILKALLASQQPSYELRHNQVESLFLSGIDAYGNQLASDSFQVTELYCRIDNRCNRRLTRLAKDKCYFFLPRAATSRVRS